MVRRILVPLDGSAESEAVLPPVAELARAEGAAVRLLHVTAPVEGLLEKVEVERGDLVRKGQVLARLESSVERATVALARARAAIQLLTFVYRDPGAFGDDRVYLVRHGLVRASYPNPTTPIEQEAFRAVVAEELGRPLPPAGLLDAATIDEMLVVRSWFRRHPDAPSTSAASSRSRGIELRPASWMTVASGSRRHTWTRITDAVARPGSPSQ